MADGDLYLSDSPNVNKGFVEQDGKLRGVVLQATPDGTLQLSDKPNVDTGYITDTDGKKHKVNLVAQVEGTVEYPEGVNADKAYVVDGDGKKHRVSLTASLYSGGSAPGKYQLLDRVKDDNNNEIGTVCSYRTDVNNQKYAVVCLDAQYRSSSGQYLSARVEVTGIPLLNNQTLWENKDTATSNCTKILDFANANGYTSSAVSHCRSKSFVIEGVTYYGQLPTIFELSDVFSHRTAINNSDTSASQYSSLIVPTSTNTWSSSQYSSNGGFYLNSIGTFSSNGAKDTDYFVMPILEIPIQ